MSSLRIVWRYLGTRPLVTVLTVASVALGVALATTVVLFARQAQTTLRQETERWDVIVGAKGSPLQLALNALYYLDAPTGNVSASVWEKVKADDMVETEVPLTMGDNYLGAPVVGTTEEFFAGRESTSGPLVARGRMFTAPMEVVVGAEIARKNRLATGMKIVGAHGWAAGGETHGDHPYSVVGILATTGTSMDRAVYADYRSTWHVHEHGEEHAGGAAHHDEAAEEHDHHAGEVTAVLIRLKQRARRYQYAEELTKTTEAMATVPVEQVDRLMGTLITPLRRALLAVAYLVALVAALTILISLYLSIHQRRRDIAVLRALGATRGDVFGLVALEASLVAGLGVLCGWALGHGAVAVSAGLVAARLGIAPEAWVWDAREVVAGVAIWALGTLAGLLPAATAYRTEVAATLSEEG